MGMNFFNGLIKGVSYRRKLSKRFVLAFTIIILIPLLVMFSLIFSFFRDQTIDGLNQIAKISVDDNVKRMKENLLKLNLIEKMVSANNSMMLFLTIPDNYSEDETIDVIKNETDSLERILSIEPLLYSIRVFADNKDVPERFPVLLNSSRTNLWDLSYAEYNYKADFLANQLYQQEPSVCFTSNLMNGKRQIGYLQISMKMENFFPFLYQKENLHENDFAFRVKVIDGKHKLSQIYNEQTIVYNPIAEYSEVSELEKALDNSNGSTTGSLMIVVLNQMYTAFWEYLPEEGLVVAHTCSTKIIYHNEMQITIYVTLGLIVIFVALFFLIKYLTSYLLEGVYSLIDGMNKVKKGNLDFEIEVISNDDVGEALQTFNLMTSQLKAQIQQIKNEQQIIADTEMKAMQNQINAHFLYNVLETIHMQAVLSDNDAIADSITVLGKMMRYCLRWRVHSVTLSQEIEYIESYLYILNLRNDYVISLDVDIPEAYYKYLIPKMLIQPFVENAFYYAIEPIPKDSVIRIGADLDEDKKILWLTIQDYGPGISDEKLEEIRKYLEDDEYERDSTGSIGIKNIQQRLRIFYGSDFRLEIKTEKGKGTIIRIPVPAKVDEND